VHHPTRVPKIVRINLLFRQSRRGDTLFHLVGDKKDCRFDPPAFITYSDEIPAARTTRDLVEARGVEPLSEDLQHNGPTCLADRFNFAATHAHRLA